MRDQATTVTSLPLRTTRARPIGSGSSPESGRSPRRPYSRRFSMYTTGLSSRIAARMRL